MRILKLKCLNLIYDNRLTISRNTSEENSEVMVLNSDKTGPNSIFEFNKIEMMAWVAQALVTTC